MVDERIRGLIEASDLAGLVRAVDGLCGSSAWDEIVALRDACIEAVERGKQVWGVTQFAEYRLALDAPAPYAGRVVKEGAGRHGLGPLWEVAASGHTWAELEPHLEDTRARAFAAHERSIRGERVDGSAVDRHVIDVPLETASWEPAYPVAEYLPDRASFPEWELPELSWEELGAASKAAPLDDAGEALLDLARTWIDDSSGRGEARAVTGDARAAIRALGPRRVRMAPIDLHTALATMTWVGASGGAHGRRRGTPAGRAAAWWALSALLGIENEWPPDPEELGQEAALLRWYAWDPGDRVGGWNFHLAVEDPLDGLAWAVSAVDWK